MAAKTSTTKYLQVAVYFGGAELGRYERPLSGSRGVTAGRSLLADIRSVIWPRWDELELIHKTKTGLILNPHLAWHGVFSDGKTTHLLDTNKHQRKTLEITANASASLRLDDLSIAIRVGPKRIAKSTRVIPLAGYGGSVLSFVADRANQWAALSVAVFASAAIAATALITLSQRPVDSYSSIRQLPQERLLPFISQKYLAEAPHVLQFGLDRFNYVHSVWSFYDDLTKTVAFGDAPPDGTKVFPTIVQRYTEMSRKQKNILEDSAARQSKTRLGRQLPQLALPMVLGESLDGRAQRTLDKIYIASSNAKTTALRRNNVAAEFEKDLGYKYEPKSSGNENAKAFGAISAGFLGLEDDEKSQFTQATAMATKAAILQMDLYGKERLVFGAANCCADPLGAPLSHDYLTWLPPDHSVNNQNDLAALKASIWGAPTREGPVVLEPKTGRLAPQLVEKTVSSGRYQIRLCYELALRRNQTAQGSMEWTWKIDTQGKINGINLIKSSIKDEEFVRCVRDKIASWRFPKPSGGSVEVRYPFEFSRDKG